MEFPNYTCIHPTITQDGKYFAFTYGRTNFGQILIPKLHIQIYDLENNKIIIEREVEDPYYKAASLIENGILMFNLSASNYSEDKVFDLENGIIYSKIYYNQSKLKARTKQGFIFGVESRNDDNTYIDTYEDKFEKENF
jgi:hypothetical protein